MRALKADEGEMTACMKAANLANVSGAMKLAEEDATMWQEGHLVRPKNIEKLALALVPKTGKRGRQDGSGKHILDYNAVSDLRMVDRAFGDDSFKQSVTGRQILGQPPRFSTLQDAIVIDNSLTLYNMNVILIKHRCECHGFLPTSTSNTKWPLPGMHHTEVWSGDAPNPPFSF